MCDTRNGAGVGIPHHHIKGRWFESHSTPPPTWLFLGVFEAG